MEENLILFTQLNDFIFCPMSIYFHNLYQGQERRMFHSTDQEKGAAAHSSIDMKTYSTRKDIMCGLDAYSERYGLVGKIDIFEIDTGKLIERKKKIKTIYDGYVFQMYAQYFALCEMGYQVEELILRSMDDNRNYAVSLPDDDPEMKERFETTINSMREFNPDTFKQKNAEKCARCIYEPACDRGL